MSSSSISPSDISEVDCCSSEESELVYRILALAGVAIEKPQLTQTGAQLASAQIQQEKQ